MTRSSHNTSAPVLNIATSSSAATLSTAYSFASVESAVRIFKSWAGIDLLLLPSFVQRFDLKSS